MTLSQDVLHHVQATYIAPARQRGETTIRVVAGDVHKDLRWTNRVPSVCTTLSSRKFQEAIGAELIAREGPPSGFGTRAAFTYRLPKENPSSEGRDRRRRNLLDLYGIAADIFRELGGGENFIRRERESLDFRSEANPRDAEKDPE